MVGKEQSVASREQPKLVPAYSIVPFVSWYFLQWISLKYIWMIVFGSIIDHQDETTCQFLFSINLRYIHILFNFPGCRKIKNIFLVLVHPGSRDLHPLAYNCEKRESSPCLFHLSSWPGLPTQVKWNGLFWIVGGPSLSMVRLWKIAYITGATPAKWVIVAEAGALRNGLSALYTRRPRVYMTPPTPLSSTWCESG